MIYLAKQWRVLVSEPNDAAHKMPCLFTVIAEGTAASIFLEVYLPDEKQALVFLYNPSDLDPGSIWSVETESVDTKTTPVLSSDEISRIANNPRLAVGRPMNTLRLDLKSGRRCQVYRIHKLDQTIDQKLMSEHSMPEDSQLQWLASAEEIFVWFDISLVKRTSRSDFECLLQRPDKFVELKNEQSNWVLYDVFKPESSDQKDIYTESPPAYAECASSLSTVPNTPLKPPAANTLKTTTLSQNKVDTQRPGSESPYQEDVSTYSHALKPQEATTILCDQFTNQESSYQKDILPSSPPYPPRYVSPSASTVLDTPEPPNLPDLRIVEEVKSQLPNILKNFLESRQANHNDDVKPDVKSDVKSILGAFVPDPVAAIVGGLIADSVHRAIHDAKDEIVEEVVKTVDDDKDDLTNHGEGQKDDLRTMANDLKLELERDLRETWTMWVEDPEGFFKLGTKTHRKERRQEEAEERQQKEKELREEREDMRKERKDLRQEREAARQKDKDLQQKEKELRRKEKSLQRKEKELQQKEKELQQKERELQRKEKELQESEDKKRKKADEEKRQQSKRLKREEERSVP